MTDNIERLLQGMSPMEINWLKSNIQYIYSAVCEQYFSFKNMNPSLFEKGKKIETPIKKYLNETIINYFFPEQIKDASNCFWQYFAYLEHDGYLEESEKRKVRITYSEHKGISWIFSAFIIWINRDYGHLNQISPKVLMYYLNLERARRKKEKKEKENKI